MNDEALFGRSSDARGGSCCGGRKLPGCGQAVQHRREQCCAVGAAVPADRERRGQADGRGAQFASQRRARKEVGALVQARQNVNVWSAEIERRGLDAILITASGCGTMIKDYGFLLRNEPAYAAKAARVSALAKDVTEFLGQLDQPEPINPQGTTV